MPANTNSRYRELTVSSGDYDFGDKNKATFRFNEYVDHMDYINLIEAVIPTTYYVFTAPNYTSMEINSTTITWPEGNYTVQEWIDVVNPQLPDNGDVTYDAKTNKLWFTATANLFVSFPTTPDLKPLLGFEEDVTELPLAGFSPPNVVAFSGPNYMYLRTNLASVFNNESVYFTRNIAQPSRSDIMKMIPITENRNSVFVYKEDPNKFFEWFDVRTRVVEFYFTLGDREEPIDFNGETFQLRFGCFNDDVIKAQQGDAFKPHR